MIAVFDSFTKFALPISGVWRSWLAYHAEGVMVVTFFRFLTKYIRGVAQLASVLAWGASGRPFESDHPDQERDYPDNKG